MKLKKHQIKRLAFLISKGEDTLTDPQRIELAGLKGIASSDEDLDLEDEAAFVKAHNVPLTDAEKAELATLSQKGAGCSADESTKHADLVLMAGAEDISVDDAFIKAHGDNTFTDTQLEAVVTKAVAKALEGTQVVTDAVISCWASSIFVSTDVAAVHTIAAAPTNTVATSADRAFVTIFP